MSDIVKRQIGSAGAYDLSKPPSLTDVSHSDVVADLRRQLAAMTERAEKADAADLRRECRASRKAVGRIIGHGAGWFDGEAVEGLEEARAANDASGALARGDGEKT